MTALTTTVDLAEAIQQHLFPAWWSTDQQRSLEWEGVRVTTTPSAPEKGKISLTVTIWLDLNKYDVQLLQNCNLRIEAAGQVGEGRLSYGGPSGRGGFWNIQYAEIKSNAQAMFTLIPVLG